MLAYLLPTRQSVVQNAIKQKRAQGYETLAPRDTTFLYSFSPL